MNKIGFSLDPSFLVMYTTRIVLYSAKMKQKRYVEFYWVHNKWLRHVINLFSETIFPKCSNISSSVSFFVVIRVYGDWKSLYETFSYSVFVWCICECESMKNSRINVAWMVVWINAANGCNLWALSILSVKIQIIRFPLTCSLILNKHTLTHALLHLHLTYGLRYAWLTHIAC